MLLRVIFIHYISIVSGNNDFVKTLLTTLKVNEHSHNLIHRSSRGAVKKSDFVEIAPTCEQMSNTALTPFIVLLLYKTSGHFLGMGSIIDKKTVLTASDVVSNALHKPSSLLILAGRQSPWWGKDSQVHSPYEIYKGDTGLAIVQLKNEFDFNKNVLPIQLGLQNIPDFNKEYDKDWGVFGIQRTSWDMPGEEIPKTSVYLMKVEREPENLDDCKAAYPGLHFNDSIMTCTYANGSFNWGCLGSPTIAVNSDDNIYQIAVVVKASYSEKDNFHVHLKLNFFEQWIRSHSLVGYDNKKELGD